MDIKKLKISIASLEKRINDKSTPEAAVLKMQNLLEEQQSKLEKLEQAEKDSSPAQEEKEEKTEVVSKKKSADKPEGKAKSKKPKIKIEPNEVKTAVKIDVVTYLNQLDEEGNGVNFPISANRKELDVLTEDMLETFKADDKYEDVSESSLREKIKAGILEIDNKKKAELKRLRQAEKKLVEKTELTEELAEELEVKEKGIEALESKLDEIQEKREAAAAKAKETREAGKKIDAYEKYRANIWSASRVAFNNEKTKTKFKDEDGKLKEDKKIEAFRCIQAALLLFNALADFTNEKLSKKAQEDLVEKMEEQAGLEAGSYEKSSVFNEKL